MNTLHLGRNPIFQPAPETTTSTQELIPINKALHGSLLKKVGPSFAPDTIFKTSQKTFLFDWISRECLFGTKARLFVRKMHVGIGLETGT